MDPVIIVSGNWVKKHRYVFNADKRGCRVLHLNEKTTYDELVKLVIEYYGLEKRSRQIQLSYMFSNKAMKTMAHDTPPIYVSNTRQLQGFLSLREIDQLHLCVEITKKEDSVVSRKDGSSEKMKRPFSYVSKGESRDDYCVSYGGFSFDYYCSKGSKSEEIRDDK